MTTQLAASPVASPTDTFLTERELAARLGLAEITLKIWRSKGRGPSYFQIGRAIRYRWSEIEAWLASQRVGSVAQKGG